MARIPRHQILFLAALGILAGTAMTVSESRVPARFRTAPPPPDGAADLPLACELRMGVEVDVSQDSPGCASVSYLINQLRKDPDDPAAFLRILAAGGPEASLFLKTWLDETRLLPDPARAPILEALASARLHDLYPARVPLDTAARGAVKSLLSWPDESLRGAALGLFTRQDGDEVREELRRAALSDGSEVIRARAILLLGWRGDSGDVPFLRDLGARSEVGSAGPEVRAALRAALAEIERR